MHHVWLDCDPGHDDAFAIMLCAFSPDIHLLGISTVSGNQTVHCSTLNAARVLHSCGISNIPIVQGQPCPTVRPLHLAADIHGKTGLDGSSLLPLHPVGVESMIIRDRKWFVVMAEAILKCPEKVHLVCTGPMTNAAILLSLYPEIKENLAQIVFMGGAVARGNVTPTSEFNIYVDPEAAHLVLSHAGSGSTLHSPFFEDCTCDDLNNAHRAEQRYPAVKVVMVPLDVTHTALVTDEVLSRLKNLSSADAAGKSSRELREIKASSPFRQMLTDLLLFFEDRYREVYKFLHPPLHDPCAVAYVLRPEIFKGQTVSMDIELNGSRSLGQTICDFYNLQKRPAPNVFLTEEMNVPKFWQLIYDAVDRADLQSPLNPTTLI